MLEFIAPEVDSTDEGSLTDDEEASDQASSEESSAEAEADSESESENSTNKSSKLSVSSINRIFGGSNSNLSEKDMDFFFFVPPKIPDDEEDEEEEEEPRKPIQIRLIEMNSNGKLSFQFSEQLLTLEQLGITGFNLTMLNKVKENFLSVEYFSKAYKNAD